MTNPLVSICIPSYKLVNYVERLLQSILKQTYKHIEIIISDDSDDDSIAKIISKYEKELNIRYFHNVPSLKTPKNWNNALKKASGDLLMLMHQDDFFSTETSIASYVNHFINNSSLQLVFSKNSPTLDNGKKIPLQANMQMVHTLHKDFEFLVFNYVVGPPSNIMFKKEIRIDFDERFIWLVDVDFCVRLFEKNIIYEYIDEQLITIGMHDSQATVFCNNNPDIVIKENVLYAAKRPLKSLNRIKLFDYYWRFIRNYNIRNVDKLIKLGLSQNEIILLFALIINAQSKIRITILRIGIFSKFFMLINYIKYRFMMKSKDAY